MNIYVYIFGYHLFYRALLQKRPIIYMYIYFNICVLRITHEMQMHTNHKKSQVFFAKEPYKRDNILYIYMCIYTDTDADGSGWIYMYVYTKVDIHSIHR